MECDVKNTESILTKEGLYHLLTKLKGTTIQESEKLKNIEEFAEKNQNAYSKIQTNDSIITASNPTDTIGLFGKGGISIEMLDKQLYVNNTNNILYSFNTNLFSKSTADRTLSTEVDIDDRIINIIKNNPDKTSVYCIGTDGNINLDFNTYNHMQGTYEYTAYYSDEDNTYRYNTQIKLINNHFTGILKIEYVTKSDSEIQALSILDINRICTL